MTGGARRRASVAAVRALAVAVLLAPAAAPAQNSTEGGRPLFDSGRAVPRLTTPEPHAPSGFDRYARRVRYAVDAERLAQALSPELSDACARNAFNQQRRGHFYVDVPMPEGPAKRFGFAGSNGLNLHDPNDIAGTDQLYLFARDGTSECRVHVFPQAW